MKKLKEIEGKRYILVFVFLILWAINWAYTGYQGRKLCAFQNAYIDRMHPYYYWTGHPYCYVYVDKEK